jgi:uncharacterized damage-inducible protein DinB
VTATLTDAASSVDADLARLADTLGSLTDGDLHRASVGGGWTVAQVVAHISVSTLVWLGDLRRLEADPELTFFFREEVGHDALGYAPPTIELALARVASTRRTLATCLPTVAPDVLARTVEIPDLGTMTIAEWTPLICGHLTSHVEQAHDILKNRGVIA